MRKLTLKLDDLRIDSFETTSGTAGKGTVFGEQCTCHTNCTCPGCLTCDAACGGNTDDATCDGCPVETNLCTYDGRYTCDRSGGGYTCDYTCQGFATYGPDMVCRIC